MNQTKFDVETDRKCMQAERDISAILEKFEYETNSEVNHVDIVITHISNEHRFSIYIYHKKASPSKQQMQALQDHSNALHDERPQ